MGKILIITEKPSVARDYAEILGVRHSGKGVLENDKYVVTWCVGHLVEMSYPEMYDPKYKKWNLSDLPFLPEQYKYDVISSVKKQYEIVNMLMNSDKTDSILYAGDSGREGQVIIELIRRFGGVRKGIEEKRVWIDSCTEEEIIRGIKEAKPIDKYDNLANAGIMRSIEDYAMGINFSRALSVKYARMLNKAANSSKYVAIAVGRVMTCVLGMVVRKEREIREFKETPFFKVSANIVLENTDNSLEWKSTEKSSYFESPVLYKENGFKNRKDAEELINQLKDNKDAEITSVKKTTEKKNPPLLFNLAELQAECSKRFKINPEETLKAVQELYEKKLTTYPRTDARVLTTAIAKEIHKNLNGLLSYEATAEYTRKIMEEKAYLKVEKSPYTDDSKVTDHYAVIPTGQTKGLSHVTELQQQIYDVIVRRFLGIFFPPAIYQKANITAKIGIEEFGTSVKAKKSLGYLEIVKKNNGNEENTDALSDILLKLKKGDRVPIKDFSIKEGKTSAPKRYTSGSMILAMENAGKLIEDEELRAQIKGAGIGTSATRAGIIDKLVRTEYIKLNKKTQILTPLPLGEMIYEVVLMTIPSMLNPEMTASWEKGLASMEKGDISVEKYKKTLENYVRKHTENIKKTDYYNYVAKRIEPYAVGTNYEYEGSSDKHNIGVKCPFCGGEVQTTPFGYGCSNYSTAGCNFAIGVIAKRRLTEEEAIILIKEGKLKNVNGFVSRKGKQFSANLKMEATKSDDNGLRVKIKFDWE